MSSPGRKPRSSSIEHQKPSSSTDTATGGTPKPRRPSGSGGLPRVATLAANKPAVPKREDNMQRTTPPPFRSGGSIGRGGASSTSVSGRWRGGAASSLTPGASSSSSPGAGRGLPGATAAGGVSRSSSRSSATSSSAASSTSRLAPSTSTNSRPAWGSTAAGGGGAPTRSLSARSTSSGAGGAVTGTTRTPSGTLRSTQSSRTPPGRATETSNTAAAAVNYRRTVSTSSAASSGAGGGRGRVVARSSSPSKIPSGPGQNTSTRMRPGGAAAALGAGAAGATAAVVVGKIATEQTEKDLDLDTLVGLMGEIKDIRHELDMKTPTAADGAGNTEFGSAAIEAEDSLPGPEFVASVDTGVIGGADGEGDEGVVVVDNLEKKESGEGVDGGEEGSGVRVINSGEGVEGENADTAKENFDDAAVLAEKEENEKPAPVVVVEESRPAFEQQPAMDVEHEKIQAKPLCSCSIM
jgi:hypothetical protein